VPRRAEPADVHAQRLHTGERGLLAPRVNAHARRWHAACRSAHAMFYNLNANAARVPTRSKVTQATGPAAAAAVTAGGGMHSDRNPNALHSAARVRCCLGRCREPLDHVGGDRAEQSAVEEHVHLRTFLQHSTTRCDAKHDVPSCTVCAAWCARHGARGMVRAAWCVGGAARCDTQAAAAARALTRHSTAAPVGVRETAKAHGHDALHASAHVRFSGIDQSSNLRPRSACGGGGGCVAAAVAQCPPSAAVSPRRHSTRRAGCTHSSLP
jgi:hypothetical protein